MTIVQEPLEKYLEKYNADATPIRDLIRIVKLSPDRVWIAGGAARKLYSNLPISSGDIDVVFQKGATLHRRIDALEKRYEEEPHYSDMSSSFNKAPIKIQLLHHLERSVEHIFHHFDISVCHFACDGVSMFYTKEAAQDCANETFHVRLREKSLSYSRWRDYGVNAYAFPVEYKPVASDYRMFKYFLMGFMPEQEEVKRHMHVALASLLGYGTKYLSNKPLAQKDKDYYIKRLTVGPGSHS